MRLPFGKIANLTFDNTAKREVSFSDFIPYACHIDGETLLTRNGELLQTIKITGFTYEAVGAKQVDLREAIREAVLGCIPNDNYALWFHTIRRKKNLDPGSFAKEESASVSEGNRLPYFPRYLHDAWNRRHDWTHQYVNELYITVVREGESGNITSPQRFLRALLPRKEKTARHAFISKAHQELYGVVEGMLEVLEAYGARRLGAYQEGGIWYSEPFRFMGKLINLEETPMPMPEQDAGDYLPRGTVAFGYNALEVRVGNRQHYGAVLTVKEYHEIGTEALDEFLQIPQEFIITQCIDFINQNNAQKNYTYQKYLVDLAEDAELAEWSGINEIVKGARGTPIDFGEQQLSIFVLGDGMHEVEEGVASVLDVLKSLGIVSFREDLRMEHCYWAMLPANFSFISRLRPMNTARIGGCASLYNFPAGKAVGNPWGPAVTVFHTALGTPYFFNFHFGDTGHTTLIGPYGAGKTVLMNFLVGEAQKFRPRMFYFDHNNASKIFLMALGAGYHRITLERDTSTVQLNPLQLEDTPENRNFCKLWIHAIVSTSGVGFTGGGLTEDDMQALYDGIDTIFESEPQARRLSTLASHMETAGLKRVVEALAPWHGEGRFSALFDHAEDTLDTTTPVHGFDISEIEQVPGLPVSVALYLFHRINQTLDGQPTLVVLDEAWTLLRHPLLADKINGWLQFLAGMNAVAILATESIEHAAQADISRSIFDQTATQIYLPNDEAGDPYRDVFGLNEDEFEMLTFMDRDKREFMMKHGGEAVVCQLNLNGMYDILSVLTAHPEHLRMMQDLIAVKGTHPKNWLPEFMEKTKHYAQA